MPILGEELRTLEDWDWLVAARNHIQTFMLHVFKEGELYKSKYGGDMKGWKAPQPAKEKADRWNLLLGATFSLWRAVFYAERIDVQRNVSTLNTHAEFFLRRLVEDNQIHYSDEKTFRSWSSGYYLNNAIYRLCELENNFGKVSTEPNAVLRIAWNDTFLRLQRAFSNSSTST
jgi:hypothetical protein